MTTRPIRFAPRRRLDYVALKHMHGRDASSARRPRFVRTLLCIRMWRLLVAGSVCVLAPCRADAAQYRGVAPIRVAALRGDTVPAASAGPTGLEGVFDVGGHKLYLRCEGRGAPTVVYLHGLIVTRGGSQNSGLIPGYLRDQAQVCIYDRANVGFSDPLPGPLTGKDAVHDLHRLLDAAHVRGPYVLLAGSFGGLVAVMYAATYPRDVAGMVLNDASLPEDVVAVDERFVPERQRLQPDDWKHNVEQMDLRSTYEQARAMPISRTDIPLTYIATDQYDFDPAWPVVQMAAAVRAEQHAFVAQFPRGRLLELSGVPHFMERAIPRTVADEVMRMLAVVRAK